MGPQPLGFVLVVAVLWAVGLFFVPHLGLGGLRRLRAWEARALRTTATVVRHEIRTYKGNQYHRPVVRFVTPSGEDVIEAEMSPRTPDPPVGGAIEVLYDSERPSVARLPGQDRGGALFIAVLGALLVVVGIAIAVTALGR